MKVTKGLRSGTRVELPGAVERPFEVYVNGVAQREGADFRVEDEALVFSRELHQEGKLGFWRWASITFGVAGTYRQERRRRRDLRARRAARRRQQPAGRARLGGKPARDGRRGAQPLGQLVRQLPGLQLPGPVAVRLAGRVHPPFAAEAEHVLGGNHAERRP